MVSTHSGGFFDSLRWQWQQRRTSHGAPSSGGRGSSPVCTRALKAKGTAGHDGNCALWGLSALTTAAAVRCHPWGGLCVGSGDAFLLTLFPPPGTCTPPSPTQLLIHRGTFAWSLHGTFQSCPCCLLTKTRNNCLDSFFFFASFFSAYSNVRSYGNLP